AERLRSRCETYQALSPFGVDAAVLGPTGLTGAGGIQGATRHDGHPAGRDSGSLEIVLHRLSAPVRERHVVLGGATRIGAADQADAHVRLLQAGRVLSQHAGGSRGQVRLVEVEVNR